MSEVTIRGAHFDDAAAIVSLLDRAMLSFDRSRIPYRIRQDAVVVATRDINICGVALLAGDHIDAIAVESSHRGDGIGRALVETFAESRATITAACHPQATDFYASLDFTLYALPSGRCFAYRRETQTSGSISS